MRKYFSSAAIRCSASPLLANCRRCKTRRYTGAGRGSRAILDRETIHIHDITTQLESEFPEVKEFQARWGHRTVLATPLLREGAASGAILIRRKEVRPFSDKQIALLRTFAAQAVIAIENVRLFQELQKTITQLDIANRHKSDFLARVSHDLRTPLNSIIGFTRIVLRRMEGKITRLAEREFTESADQRASICSA